jgi:hypothetical protein
MVTSLEQQDQKLHLLVPPAPATPAVEPDAVLDVDEV